ncbi:hypothetical protein COU59_00850 [Candidatus Pacearchaeota archaeon CG10_big_fil_rev_8_21_14_0_10_34_12]|nr:MAG: hypothetical protein COU59_00850 [Candidatus Pacearchaeota archaeon CG10_big_fil_rev_8_21_14_0_10_34_12]
MNKRGKKGQFFLIAAILILAVVASLAVVYNYSSAKNSEKRFYIKNELGIESEKVLDYALNNGLNAQAVLRNFTESYSNHSTADEFFYLFGKRDNITVSGFMKDLSGEIIVNTGFGNQEVSFSQNQFIYREFTYIEDSNVSMTINNVRYNVNLSQGINFYYVIFKKANDENYVFTNIDSGIFDTSMMPHEELIISSNTTNYNIFNNLANTDEAVEVMLTINSGVVVGSSSISEPSLTTGVLPSGSRITLINNGYILGKGGEGGGYPGGKTSGNPGSDGGPALQINTSTSIQNNGIIGGGGGGGGAGGSGNCGECYDDPGGSGGGGAGYNIGEGGHMPSPNEGTYPGENGTLFNGGAGGEVTYIGSAEYLTAGDGGAGGNLGLNGNAGENGDAFPGGAGGKAGKAVIGDSLVSWMTQGDIRGSII